MPYQEVESEPFFLFLGTAESESTTSRLKTTGIRYRIKRLDSSVENWQTIVDLLASEHLIGVMAKLTPNVIHRMYYDPGHQEIANAVFEKLGKSRHILFAHEQLLGLVEPDQDEEEAQAEAADEYIARDPVTGSWRLDDPWEPELYDTSIDPTYAPMYDRYKVSRWKFDPLDQPAKEFLDGLLARYAINLAAYKTNAEVSVLASSFLSQNEKHLLFRIYIPADRLWAAESAKLFDLFCDWLSKVKKQKIRHDGYKTGQGEVYEFFASDELDGSSLASEFEEFTAFLEMCLQEPDEAARVLAQYDVQQSRVRSIVARYSKEARRIRLDVKHDLETRVLAVRHRLESELADIDLSPSDITTIVNSVIPATTANLLEIAGLDAGNFRAPSSGITINVNGQLIGAVQGNAIHDFQGTLNLGSEAKELLELIREHGGARAGELSSAVHELEDEDARPVDRLTARQKLRAFLYSAGGHGANIAGGLLQKYLETRLGLS